MFKPKLIYVAVVATLLVTACGEEKNSATATVLPYKSLKVDGLPPAASSQ